MSIKSTQAPILLQTGQNIRSCISKIRDIIVTHLITGSTYISLTKITELIKSHSIDFKMKNLDNERHRVVL